MQGGPDYGGKINYIPEFYFSGSGECYKLDVLKLDSIYEYELDSYN